MRENASLFVLGSFVVACCAKVARLPMAGESLAAEAFTIEAGGKGFNLALGARRLGAAVDGVFAIGDDPLSGLAEPAFREAGLSTAMLTRHPGQTGSGVGFTDAAGETCLAVFPGANGRLGAADVAARAEPIRSARIVLATFEIADEPIEAAFALAHEAGRTTLLNPSPFRSPTPSLLRRTSILVVNQTEAAHLAATFGALPPDGERPEARYGPLARSLHAVGPRTLVVTLGGEGAVAFRAGEPTLLRRAFPARVVDTLGAGDAFTAGFCTGLAGGSSFEEALRRAAACGALATERLGVRHALPTAAALTSRLDAEELTEAPAL